MKNDAVRFTILMVLLYILVGCSIIIMANSHGSTINDTVEPLTEIDSQLHTGEDVLTPTKNGKTK